jgi:hypothetical protein
MTDKTPEQSGAGEPDWRALTERVAGQMPNGPVAGLLSGRQGIWAQQDAIEAIRKVAIYYADSLRSELASVKKAKDEALAQQDRWMRAGAEEALRANAAAQRAQEVKEKCARICEKMAEPGENDGYTEGDTNAFIWTNKEAEWASIKLGDAAQAIRSGK